MDSEYDNPPPGSPLSQVLHQEEGVEDVHAVRGLVQDDDVSVQLEMAGHVESPLLRGGEVGHPGVLHLAQAQVLYQSINLEIIKISELD